MLEHLGDKLVLRIDIAGRALELDFITILMSWIVMLILIGLALWLRKGLREEVEAEPSSRQVMMEYLIEILDEQFLRAFESDMLRKRLFAFVSTLFLFTLVSNWISVIPGFQSPTRDLNVPLGFAFLVFFLSHYYGMKINGTGTYLKSFFEPYPFMAPLNVISEVAKPLSHSFRLFGNVFGGAVLVAVVSAKLIPFVLPAFLQIFYGLFIGAVQAFVFALLAVAYINVAVEG